MPDTIEIWKSLPSTNRHIDLKKVDLNPVPASLNAATNRLPSGVYTTFRTYEGDKVLPLEYQIRRLEESALLIDQPLRVEEWLIRAALRRSLKAYSNTARDVRVRLTIDLEQEPGAIYIALEPLQIPSALDYTLGVWAVTRLHKRRYPRSKRTAFVLIAETIRQDIPKGVHEALLTNQDGQILEGLSSNFFAVKNGEIWTAGEGVLPGITRALVLQAVHGENLILREESLSLTDLTDLQEAFLTSSSRSVLPVRQIDEVVIGPGHPGPVTKRIAEAYNRVVRSQLVKI
jgi:branched-chain amino acid aminotransferase